MTTSLTRVTRYAALILAVCSSVFASCKKTPVPVSVTSISLSSSYIELEEGESYELIATISPYNADNTQVIWSTDNGKVASVEGGIITALKAGKATITAKSDDGGHAAECNVKVLKPVSEEKDEDGNGREDENKEDSGNKNEEDDDSDEENRPEQEEPEVPAEPESETRMVTFTFKLPRAPKSAEMMQLVYEIYSTEDSYAETFGENDQLVCHESIEFFGDNTTIDVEVKRDANYTALFWVQHEDNGIYDVTSLTDVTIPTELPSNTSITDAFAGRSHIVADWDQTDYEVQLIKPISKLTIKVNSYIEEYLEAVRNSSAAISINDLYTTYDVSQLKAKGNLSTIHFAESHGPWIEEDERIIICDSYVGFAGESSDEATIDLTLSKIRSIEMKNILIGSGKWTNIALVLSADEIIINPSVSYIEDNGTK